MEGEVIIQFLSDYGYWILLPLMIMEGPIVTLIAAFMASVGVFDVWIVLILSVAGDLIGDVIFYGIGRRWGMPFVDRYGKYFGISHKIVFRMEKFFIRHGGKTIFLVKSTTGLCWATFIAAGIIKMLFRKFLFYSLIGGLVWSGALVAVGYFFGYLYEQIAQYIEYAGWIIFSLAVIFFIGVNIFKKHEKEEIFSEVVKNNH